jgi:hypothetical protein
MGAGQVKGKFLKGLRKSIYTLTTVLHCQAVICMITPVIEVY